MVELHGWLKVCECCGDEDKLSDDELCAVRRAVEDIINRQDCGVLMKHANGEAYLEVLHCANHKTAQVDEIIGVFSEVEKAADGSYGVIYLRDDEDRAHQNEFQVFIFKRGQCIRQKDKLLSPCIPEIEDSLIPDENAGEVLRANLDKLGTTDLGAQRIAKNLGIDSEDAVGYCKDLIKRAHIERKGKNFYAEADGCVITINAGNFSIITAHRIKNKEV